MAFPDSSFPISSDTNRLREMLESVERVNERLEGLEKLVRGMADATKDAESGKPVIEMVEIPSGPFLYGEDKQLVHLSTFLIAKCPLTNTQYRAFLDATAYAAGHWSYPEGKENHPAVNISYHDAQACAMWYGLRLPTEQEWEKAARGTYGRIYPWGNQFHSTKCNTRKSRARDTTPVDAYPEGASPYGVMDMAGNVWEWTSSLYKTGDKTRVLRGGSWDDTSDFARCSIRLRVDPDYRYYFVGVRFSRTL